MPTLVLNPRYDTDFVTLAESIVAEGIGSAHELEERLQQRYAHVLVRARELNGEMFTIWYVYRDGHWIPGQGPVPEGG